MEFGTLHALWEDKWFVLSDGVRGGHRSNFSYYFTWYIITQTRSYTGPYPTRIRNPLVSERVQVWAVWSPTE